MTKTELNKFIDEIKALRTSTSDASATTAPELYPTLQYTGKLIKYKTRIQWTDGNLYMAQYDTYDREDTDPDHDTNGWAKLEYKDGYRFIPDTMTTATMFSLGERGWYRDVLYESLIDNNSWTPVDYPAGWKTVTL